MRRIFLLFCVMLTVFTADRLLTASGAKASQSLPLAETSYVLGDSVETYAAFMMSGGPPPDGIPSIDRPRFRDADRADLRPDDIVMGFHHNGEARAYPQKVMVWHEIVNDRVGGLNVAITYCPLTATAQGFKRGDTTLGVSGQLLNSNVVLFDRESGSRFSQIAAVGLDGRHRGRTLDEVNVVWTTWERWRAAFPETLVLSDETGHLRNYERDPYGSYTPRSGYYSQAGTIFPLMHSSDRHHEKEMVVGARTSDRSVYFVLSDLARARVQSTASFVAVYDPGLDAGHLYLRGDEDPEVLPRGNGMYELGGQVYAASDLPLTSAISVEAFFFAWYSFYPESEFVDEGGVAPGESVRGDLGR